MIHLPEPGLVRWTQKCWTRLVLINGNSTSTQKLKKKKWLSERQNICKREASSEE